MRRWRISRDTILLLIGVVVVAHETFLTSVDRPWLLGLAGGCLGLPAFLTIDRRRGEKAEGD